MGLSLLAAGSLVLAQGVAYADPSEEELDEEIDELTEEVSVIVEDLNQAEEDVEAAELRVEELEDEIGDEEDRYEELHGEVIEFAGALYSGTDLDSPTTVLSADSPEQVQEQAADLGYLSDSQTEQLDEFAGSGERLIALKDEAEEALEDVEDQRDELEEQRDEVEEQLDERESEREELYPSSNSGGGGASYDGSASGDARVALDYAYAQVGKSYCQSPGTGPDCYDCSGLMQQAWAAAGVSLPRTTGGQIGVGHEVARSDVQPGDLLFFYSGSHVGMYAGNGQMVHSANPRKPIEVVSLSAYYDGVFLTARRV